MKSAEASITINGRAQLIRLPCTAAQVLDEAGLKPTQVVVERNGSVLPRLLLTETFLEDGDRLEVILPVAGG
jgi:sulfur carrier protein